MVERTPEGPRVLEGGFWFGPAERPCFGWLHRGTIGNGVAAGATGVANANADAGAASPPAKLAVVICNPFGHETQSAHRSIRHFAESAARLGLPTLRFDYHGTGDSAGSDLDPARVRAWLDSIHHACDTMREQTGASNIALIGIRLGALLATVAASEREDIAGIATLAPFVRGREFLREVGALQAAHEQSAAETSKPASAKPAGATTEALGFLLREDTRDALSAIDLMQLTRAPAPSMLILDRDDLPRAARWIVHLQALGVAVDAHRVDGHAQMMLDPHLAEVPKAQIALVGNWLLKLDARDEVRALVPGLGPASADIRAGGTGGMGCIGEPGLTAIIPTELGPVRERICLLDPATRLFGIASDRPDSLGRADLPANASARRKAFVLINAGAVHRIGVNRLYVDIAREWAAHGHLVLRIDIAGIGDSPARDGKAENLSYAHTAAADVAAAIRWLRREAPDASVHAGGLCAGAFHALRAAVAGEPIAHLVMINPLAFRMADHDEGQPEYAAQDGTHRILEESARYSGLMFDPASWKKLLRGGVNLGALTRVMSRRIGAALGAPARELARLLRIPLRDDLGTELALLARRDIGMHFVFSATDPGLALLHLEGGRTVERLVRSGALRKTIIAQADHTFTLLAPRSALLDELRHYATQDAQTRQS